MKFKTKSIHSGQAPDPLTGSVVTPIVTSVIFSQKSPGEHTGFEYSRVSTPTRKALEDCFSDLAGGNFSLALASGCASMHLITQLLTSGDTILAEEDLYGGSIRLLEHLKKTQNLKVVFIDFSDLDVARKKISELKPQMIWIETPTNPLLKIIDIKKIAEEKSKESLLVVDNTFLTPYFQTPLSLGADIVFHSATKYIGGHSDCLSGLIVTKREDLKESLSFLNKAIGATLSPFDSYLLLRSLKTLGLRMDAHVKNAQIVAEYLEKHDQVKKVLYPGLKSHPQFELGKKQASGSGGVMSFYIKGSGGEAKKFLENLKLFTLAESLGAVESLAEQPLVMTHGLFGSSGVTETLIRLSVGIEHIEDLLADLDQAFKAL